MNATRAKPFMIKSPTRGHNIKLDDRYGAATAEESITKEAKSDSFSRSCMSKLIHQAGNECWLPPNLGVMLPDTEKQI